MTQKNLLVLGASGACGQWVVEQAKERGYHVTALVRTKGDHISWQGVDVVQGDVLNADALDKVMLGQDAVISCLGIKRKNQANPWSPLVSPSDLAEKSAQNIVRAMNQQGVKRLVAISAAGIRESKNKINFLTQFLIRKSNVNITYQDLDKMEAIFESSGIDSLAVQPVTLVNDSTTQKAKRLDYYAVSSKIAKRDVATWMLDAIERPAPFESPSEIIGWS